MSGARWRVERAGTHGRYLPGWLAVDALGGEGARLGSHAEAIAFVDSRMRARQRKSDLTHGLGKLGIEQDPPRFAPSAPPPESRRTRRRAEARRVRLLAEKSHTRRGPYRARLTAEDVAAMRELRAAGYKVAAIAHRFGSTIPTVTRHTRGAA